MAVWGAPVAKEDDAERAVQAGLELVSTVAGYGTEHADRSEGPGRESDRGAATTETAEEGIVIGDRVNTAADPSAAPPGSCYVDETTGAAPARRDRVLGHRRTRIEGKGRAGELFQATRRRHRRRLAALRVGSRRPSSDATGSSAS